MKKARLIFYASMAAWLFLSVLELAGFFVFRDMYKAAFEPVSITQGAFAFAIRLLAVSVAAAIFIAFSFDLAYRALPGGFLRKAMNFGAIFWGLSAMPAASIMYAGLSLPQGFMTMFLAKQFVIAMVISLVLTGIYEEQHNREKIRKAAEMNRTAAPAFKAGVKEQGEKTDDDKKEGTGNNTGA